MTHPVYQPTDAILTAARERGRAASAQTKREQRDPLTGQPWYLFCSVADFMAYLERIEAEKGIVHARR